jgi:hypothetical protein
LKSSIAASNGRRRDVLARICRDAEPSFGTPFETT